jgi:hypothetical protein
LLLVINRHLVATDILLGPASFRTVEAGLGSREFDFAGAETDEFNAGIEGMVGVGRGADRGSLIIGSCVTQN